MTSHDHSHSHSHTQDSGDELQYKLTQASSAQHSHATQPNSRMTAPWPSVLAWPAWLRVAAIMPVLIILWLGVRWANEGAS